VTTIAEIASAEYVLLTTFKKDGTGVGTPLWVGRDGDGLVVWTPTDTWKVKRIRRDPRVTVAPCDFRGNPKGPEVEGKGEILDSTETERVRDILSKKYGIKGRLLIAGSKLRRGSDGTIGIRVSAI
jgi:PPOX class probable F420-dependent enzyme